MSNPLPAPLRRWYEAVDCLRVSFTNDAVKDGQANMLVFSLEAIQSEDISAEAVDEFLKLAFVSLSRSSYDRDSCTWFYAWHDEMSGTLRMSLCRAGTDADLPFRCRTRLVSNPRRISNSVLNALHRNGIPWNELVDIVDENMDCDGDDDEEIVLTVYVRQLAHFH